MERRFPDTSVHLAKKACKKVLIDPDLTLSKHSEFTRIPFSDIAPTVAAFAKNEVR